MYDEFHELPLTPKIAKGFQEEQGDFRLNGYVIATETYVELMSKILERNSDFEALKKELTEFIDDRKEFVNWADDRFDHNTARYNIE